MRRMSFVIAVMLTLMASSADAFQTSGGTGTGTGTGIGNGTGTGTGGSNPLVVAAPWRFTHPNDGLESFSNVLFMGTGPLESIGGLSVYSYTNSNPLGVYPGELQLEMAVIVDTDPGIDWVGPIYETVGVSYATVMPTLGTPNLGLLSLVDGGGTPGSGTDLGTLTLLGGGQGVLFQILPH